MLPAPPWIMMRGWVRLEVGLEYSIYADKVLDGILNGCGAFEALR